MSAYRDKIIEYLFMLPLFAALILPIGEFLYYMGWFGVDRIFFLCYLYIFLALYGYCYVIQKERWILGLGIALLILMALIFRDLVLIKNMAIALLSVLVLLVLEVKKIRRIGWIALAGVSGGIWIYFWNMPKFVAVALIISFISGIAILIGKDIKCYAGVFLVLMVLLMVIPSKDEPIKWTFVKKTFAKVGEIATDVRNEIEYIFSDVINIDGGYTGYNNTGKLGGGVKYSSREEMYISSGRKFSKNIYLKGAEYSEMGKNGFSDKHSIDSDYNAWMVEFLNTLYHEGIDTYEAACFSKLESTIIEYRFLKTTDLIVPENPVYITDMSGAEIKDATENRKGKGFRYKVQYMLIDYASPYYTSLEFENETYEDYETICDYYEQLYITGFKSRMTKERYDRIVKELSAPDEKYLDTSMATDQIRELAEKITADSDSDFEKAKKIEAFLRQYKYDTEVDLRKSDNYVEEFLFEKQKGYCVHYAASMVLLLRSSGIPARYVSGYSHTYIDRTASDNKKKKDKENKKKNNSNIEVVLSSDAHAWPEAYIKGLGWVRFEPTVVMKPSEAVTWGLQVDESEYEKVDIGNLEDYIPDQYLNMGKETPINIPNVQDNPELRQKAAEREKEIMFRTIYYAVATLLALLLIVVLVLLGRYIYFLKLSPEKRLCSVMNHLCSRLDRQLIGKGNVKPESIYGYLEYVEDQSKQNELKDIFDEYYKVRFRRDEVKDELLKRVVKFKIKKGTSEK